MQRGIIEHVQPCGGAKYAPCDFSQLKKARLDRTTVEEDPIQKCSIACTEELQQETVHDIVAMPMEDENQECASRPLGAIEKLEEITPEDRQIVSMMYVFEELKSTIGSHSMYNCTIQNMELIGRRRCGLRTLFYFKCNMCERVDKIWSEPDKLERNLLQINQAAVVGTHAAGFGHAQMEQMLAAMNISCMSSPTYVKLCALVDLLPGTCWSAIHMTVPYHIV
ncbi:hypothetical protein PV327_009031 [Microctonus hyperodae]|uniref:Mutator-like transposase domain-containing protein n=1 Tax=Microctonus hyperodae TaxID=165561 RepID=A0AA39KVA7_MICHY|nr:hypothetical protein PV327_009031 [Microctonus hyperodae]